VNSLMLPDLIVADSGRSPISETNGFRETSPVSQFRFFRLLTIPVIWLYLRRKTIDIG
jgi:hypothetical protein